MKTRASRREFLSWAAIALVGAMAGCAPKAAPAATTAPTDVPAQATAVPAAPPTAAPQEKIKLVMWDWWENQIPLWEDMSRAYEAKTDGAVSFELTIIGWGDYAKKVYASVPSGTGPDIFRVHGYVAAQFLNNKLIEPLPEELFPRHVLNQEYQGVKEGEFDLPDGQIYVLADGSAAPVLMISRAAWDEAGLTDADKPKTFAELIDIAKELTKTDASGEITVNGFNPIGGVWDLWRNLLYQLGSFHYSEDEKKVLFDTEAGRYALRFIDDIFSKHKVCSRTALAYSEGFGTGKDATIWGFSWMHGTMSANYPDVEYFTIPLPTLEEKVPAYGLKVWSVGPVANPQAPGKRKENAWKVLEWYFLDDEHDFLLREAGLLAGLPQKLKLQQDPTLLADDMARSLLAVSDRSVNPGGEIGEICDSQYRYVDQLFVQGSESLETTIQGMQSEGDQILAGLPPLWISERKYKYASEFKS